MATLAAELEERRSEWPGAVLVFVTAAFLLWLLAGNLFVLGLDEGIYLEGAVRILRGQVPYRDFFALTGPGSYWLDAAAMKLLGVSLAHGRVVMALDIALVTALVYWLTAQLAERGMALGAAFAFFAFETGISFRLYANHRWDSSALGMLGVAFAFQGTRRPRGLTFAAAGLFAAAAAWCTPSVLLLVITLGLWILASDDLRKYFLVFCGGVLVCSLPAAAVLAHEGGLVAMIHDMLWSLANYSGPNRVYYGYGVVPHTGGLAAVFAGAHGTELLIRALDFFLVLLPPLLPVAVYAAWLLRTRKGAESLASQVQPVLLLLVSSVTLVISTYPRWSADQLIFVSPVFYVLAACLMERFLPGRLQTGVYAALLALAIATFGISVSGLTREPSLQTRAGQVRAVPQDQTLIAALDSTIQPGDSLFVFPYLPIVYFLTGGVNPTAYDFLQPGMMTATDEASTLTELRAHPPQWVVYFEFPPATFFGIWPHADPNRMRFNSIEDYLHANYHLVKTVFHPVAKFAILERN